MNSDSQRRISLVNSVKMYNNYNKKIMKEELTFINTFRSKVQDGVGELKVKSLNEIN